MSVVRHYFPGNNTPRGFFSYYEYILGQREANRIVCIKGGPGTGKSTFLKKIGKKIELAGIDIDYLHCSADADSLDGILLPEKKIALIDGTSPHVIDPITPGAVDYMLNFGDFWDMDKIAAQKESIISHNEACSRWYRIAYHYLRSAKAVLDGLSMIQEEGIEVSEIYKLAADIIKREFASYDISIKSGCVKKFFATGITPDGTIDYIKSLVHHLDKIYLMNVPEGYGNYSFMQIISDGAVYRGFDVEAFYCPMDPENKIEHLMIPELGLGFVTTNQWHDLEPWAVMGEEQQGFKDITLIDISDYQSIYFVERNKAILTKLSKLYAQMLNEAIDALAKAKENHDIVERMYIQNMDFAKVNLLAEKMAADLLEKKEG